MGTMVHTHDNRSMLSQGILIFIYLAVLTGLEFFVAVTFNSVPLLIVVALVKAALVVYYYMHVYKLSLESEVDDASYDYKAATNRLGLWLFLISDTFVFAGLMVMRINLLGLSRPELNQVLGLGVTAVLLISSFFMNRGETLMRNGDRQGFLNNTAITFLLGLGFLLGVVFVEWRLAIHEGLTPVATGRGWLYRLGTLLLRGPSITASSTEGEASSEEGCRPFCAMIELKKHSKEIKWASTVAGDPVQGARRAASPARPRPVLRWWSD